MIQTLSIHYQKHIALAGALLIYAQFLFPLFAKAERQKPYFSVHFRGQDFGTAKHPVSFAEHIAESWKEGESISGMEKKSEQVADAPDQLYGGGPGQPEMSSFQSVNGANMVDLFSGDFSYNIPLLDVGGYPVNIHYSSGITMDQEASWVGLGWNINPGTISRNMRGLPDDFNGSDSIVKTLNIKQNKTIGVKLGAQAEMAGFPLTVGASLGVFHNNYNGWGVEQSVNAAISMNFKNKGDLTSGDSSTSSSFIGGNFGINSNSQSGLSISKSLNVNIKKAEGLQNVKSSNYGISTNYHTRAGISALTIDLYKEKLTSRNKYKPDGGVNNVTISFAQPSITPSISIPTTSNNYVFHLKTGGELFGFHANVFVQGYVNKQVIKKEDKTQKLPAFGYIHYSESAGNQHALLDFNREKELQFSYKSTPNLAIPQYTYDIYSISGEGTGGTIRPYRGDIGYSRDHFMRTKSTDDQFSFEIGGGNIIHTGFSYDFVRAFTENSEWNKNNNIRSNLSFQKGKQLYEAVYFRNPGERTSNDYAYYQKVGDDALVRVKLDRSSMPNVSASNKLLTYKNGLKSGEINVNAAIRKEQRDKRSQVVTYLSAKETMLYGLDKEIRSYKENTVPVGACVDTIEVINRVDDIRKPHHLSQIDVLNADGRRYIYGLPAYNVEQKDVTFAVSKNLVEGDLEKGLVQYAGNDNTENNNKGKDNYFNQEKLPPYAHSFLLTGILSPDYVDVKEDGITEDDLGDAVRFNYTRVYGPSQGYYEWRTPGELNKATYNEGLKSYSRDDKASYFFGEKEVWYTHSIESKTMVALFKLSSDRKDAFAAAGENGGINQEKSLRKLEQIELYSRADLLKNGQNAKPIKTVHFEYSYELCKNYYGNSEEGKLTLKKIWFTYNGNEKGKQNPYVFNYTGFNPDYHPKHSDRWANYKSPSNNPGGLNNADYPYTGTEFFSSADSALAAQHAGAWHLNEIVLPAGAKMKITYEADDYAFIQNKRATQFTDIAGFGSSATSTPSNNLYGSNDYDYIFINSPVSIADKKDIRQKYLDGIEWLYMKLAVVMPTDQWGSGYDFVPVYAKIADWGKVDGQNRFWLKLEKVQGVSPMLRSSLQFLKNNLPSKAYPTSELGDDIDLAAAVKMLLSHSSEVKNAVSGFEKASMQRNWCKLVDLNRSHIRLTAPEYKKLGGGVRVKKVEVYDNWSGMTGLKESVYGQEYQYRTSIKVNGLDKLVSSGVASYEPMIGNEENPFRQPIPYVEKMAPFAPVSYLYSEMPLGESYFPGASVGYSKVRVRTIHTKAKSANGWEEKEFYTTKDFPTLVEHTLLDQDAKARFKPKLLNLLKVYSVDRTTVSQGFKVELNDMNGKPKSSAFYAESDSLNPISYSRNYYKVENERAAQLKLNNTVWVVDSANGKIDKNGIIGKDIELITDFRQQKSFMTTGGLSPNLDYFQIGIFPVPLTTFFKFPQFDETQFRSVTTVKVVQRYGILDSIVVMDKGSVVSTKNILYDGETGEVVLSRTNNEFNDPVYNFSYPAHWAYSGMGMAYKNIHAEFSNIKVVQGKAYINNSRQPYPLEEVFESGDELWAVGLYFNPLTGANCLDLATGFPNIGFPKLGKLWIVDASKGNENDQGLYIMEKDGRPFSGILSSVKVLRSGKRNLLNASAGSVVSMENPIKETSPGNYQLKIDSTIRVINASVNSYGDLWQVENGLFVKDTIYRVTKNYTTYLSPVAASRRVIYTRTGHPEDTREDNVYGIQSLVSSYNYIRGGTGCRSRAVRSKSIVQYDLSNIPVSATINSAEISFTGRKPELVWRKFRNDCSRRFESYDWTTATDYYKGDTRVNLKRITSPWNSFTKYHDFATTNSNQVQLTSSLFSGVSVTGLLQESVQNPNATFGFMLEMVKNSPSNNSSSEINYLSFCAQDGGSTGLACGGGGASMLGLTVGCNCTAPVLYLDYTVVEDSLGYVCRYNINDTAVNPYRWGILGNWRVDSVYSYYNDRVESDANSVQTNIRREGVLKGFRAYWNFDAKGLVATRDTTRWVWNSVMNGYNRRGFEVENFDPLGRYNAGLYGYNQSLPIAVGQNTRYQELLSDGFEDYSYSTDDCSLCLQPREVDFVKDQSGVSISSAEAHTGLHSMQVNAGAESKLAVPVTSSGTSLVPQLSLKVDSTAVYSINVVGAGTGLLGVYEGYTQSAGVCTNTIGSFNRIDTSINFNWAYTSPHPDLCIQESRFSNFGYVINWIGKVQAKVTGKHRFYVDYTGIIGMSISKGDAFVSLVTTNVSGKAQTAEIDLVAGELYDIRIDFRRSARDFSRIRLSWSSSMNFSEEIIPKRYLYPSTMATADTVGSVQRNILYYCVKLNNASGQQIIRPKFSPIQNSKMVLSAWVKMGGADCNTAPALENVIRINYNDESSGTGTALTKTGTRIDGWQRYEAVITVPSNADMLNIIVQGVDGRQVFVDDIRVQPYNSALKAFVYDPVSLRLMADLDENNYASFYEYDDDGTLIRVKKETEKGIMTIRETRSALIKDNE
ncbi:PA14 domain-containing protein [Flavihumibacter sp. CACIAM 22H1]|uniref:PA14 domain-containing protein n=1 Tax=Flavihumibacter sp. CACIAM 22H1 TaxID=1812911 RepID=UPI0007A837BA|nr:PA14 domain-containing protein [Flavihumibacter sp. CACIAM 22H1]KYP14097.1 MAG: hypothetical protein A1D16_00055 [Flavihumibacter sp. CACIAM 22H1]